MSRPERFHTPGLSNLVNMEEDTQGDIFSLTRPHSMWDLSSPTRDRTQPPASLHWKHSLNSWTPREVLTSGI